MSKNKYLIKSLLSVCVAALLLTACNNQEENFSGYLFAYFEGASGDRQHQEQLRFALSRDAIDFKALNNNEPILNSELITNSGGIRDPHILRGTNDNYFYLTVTDMCTGKNGWKKNPGIVLLRSDNLIDWEHAIINLEEQYPVKFKDVWYVWAPQTIYDPLAQKYMVYFTIKYKDDDKLDFYAAYANKSFTGFEQEPELLFSPEHGGIDADIVFKDDVYHLFFKGNLKDADGKEIKSGIRQAIAATLQGPWEELPGFLDAYHDTRRNVEGSSVFKLNDSEEYILMYDLYSSGRYEFQRSTDLYNFSEKPESFTKDFHPRHGSIIGITEKEYNRLEKKWEMANAIMPN